MYFKVLGLATFCMLSVIMLIYFVLSAGGDKTLDKVMDTKQAHERHNILVMGTDKGETRSDVMMICSVSEKDNTVNIMSIPRDARIYTGKTYQKLNAAIGIGGDEFAVILRGEDYERSDELVKEFRKTLTELRRDPALDPWERVSVSDGIALYDSRIDKSIDDLFRHADNDMYNRKRASKANH
jgi:hypothetical protein